MAIAFDAKKRYERGFNALGVKSVLVEFGKLLIKRTPACEVKRSWAIVLWLPVRQLSLALVSYECMSRPVFITHLDLQNKVVSKP